MQFIWLQVINRRIADFDTELLFHLCGQNIFYCIKIVYINTVAVVDMRRARSRQTGVFIKGSL